MMEDTGEDVLVQPVDRDIEGMSIKTMTCAELRHLRSHPQGIVQALGNRALAEPCGKTLG